MKCTPDQIALIGYLIDEAMRDEDSLERRWRSQFQKAAPFARLRANEGSLLLVRDWTEDIVLSRDGEVIIIDTEDGQPPRVATEAERRIALFRSIASYPELLSFLPTRPAEATTCAGCAGTGVSPARFVNPGLRAVVCSCGGAGWTIEKQPH